uniref:F-box domain-containing protein n=1 Tax=Strongyloides papillosus TaxID=174720 RepID=A0A0N5BUW5_STREA
MDKPAMDLLSLPDDFKLQILKKLEWNTLKDVKLVCKKLYSLIERNIQSLDKPKVCSLSITYDGIKIFKVDYKFILTEDTWGSTNSKVIEFSNDDEYEKFLKNIDLTEIQVLRFKNLLNGEYISVHYESDFGEGFSTYDFYVKLPNGKYNGKYFSTRVKNSEEFGILYDSNLLRKESLKKLGFFERNIPRSVGKKIAMGLITGNSILEYGNAPTDTRIPLYIQLTSHLFKLGLLNPENTCGRKGFKLLFNEVSKFGVSRQRLYRKFFDKIKFRNNFLEENNDERYSIMNSMTCSKCFSEHSNILFYHKSSRTLEIEFR